MLLHIYAVYAFPESTKPQAQPNGHARENGQDSSRLANGHARSASEARQIQDAEAFELQGLISDEEDEGEAANGRASNADARRKPNDDDEESRLVGKETPHT